MGGVLSKSLRQIAEYLDAEKQIRQRVKAAFIYPKIVFSLCIAVSVFLVTFVVPRFMVLYENLTELPMPTKIVLWLSKFIPKYWWALLLVGVLGYFGYAQFKKSKFGKKNTRPDF